MSVALNELGLDALTATIDDVHRRFKQLARVHHPDVGGSPDAFNKLSKTRDDALYEIGQRTIPVCPTCDGAGTVLSTFGFTTLRRKCGDCR